MSVTPELDGGPPRTVYLLLAWEKRKTNVSQAVRTTMKEIIYIRDQPRTEASSPSNDRLVR